MNKLAIPLLALVGAIGMAVSIYLIFFVAPLQYGFDEGRLNGSSLFFNQKIFYFHTAHAILLLVGAILAGLSSIVYLKTRNPMWDDLTSAMTDVAVLFGAIALVSGSAWAEAAWDVWWKWEPRLTTTLLLWLLLVGYVLVRQFAGPSGDRITSGMAIFGMVAAVFVYKMAGQDSHPAAGTEGVVATLGPGMKGPFWFCILAILCWYLALVFIRFQSTRSERDLRELREHGLDLGVLQ